MTGPTEHAGAAGVAQGRHLIGDCWLTGEGAAFESSDPATGAPLWEGQAASAWEVDLAVTAAGNAFEDWAELPVSARQRYLEAFAERLRADERRLAELISREVGKPLWESLEEVGAMVGKVALSIRAHEERRAPAELELSGVKGAVRFKPHGVVAVLGPFNFPGHLPNGDIVPALLAGNTVVFKPSELAPQVAQRMAELWQDAGLPPGVLNLLHGGRETGAAIARHTRLDGLLFTGSAAAGRSLHREFAGEPHKILALEMGGNNPLVVWEASDIDAASYNVILSSFITSGQRCSCARRLILPAGRGGDALLERLIAMTNAVCVGAYTRCPEPFMGPVISDAAADTLLAAQSKLIAGGGVALCEMRAEGEHGRRAMLRPGLMDVTEVRDRPDAELFGPLLQVIRVADFDDAVREANNTVYGLVAGLLSDERALYERFYRRVRAGVVNWNRPTTGASGRLPFGGVGLSGNHRPSAFWAADYCSYPVASLEIESLARPPQTVSGIEPPDAVRLGEGA